MVGQAISSFCLLLAVMFGENEQDTHNVVYESLIQQKHMSLVNMYKGTLDFEVVEIAESQFLHVEAGPSSV